MVWGPVDGPSTVARIVLLVGVDLTGFRWIVVDLGHILFHCRAYRGNFTS